jgi:hypothetical protein
MKAERSAAQRESDRFFMELIPDTCYISSTYNWCTTLVPRASCPTSCLETLKLGVFGRDHEYKFSVLASILTVIGHSKVEWATSHE